MKAVIMAGGKGTRLRPLTCHLPKPMVPLAGRPCMEYIIELLRQHGITEIAVTVQYLPDVIRDYFGDGHEFGVQLHYFEEMSPLGTAGSVKNAQSFLDEAFIVISGDALTDFNLSESIAFHQAKQSLATLVLTPVEHPLEYGVVMTDESGKIIRFLEKPSWGEVFSDTVNTGIYILEPEVLDRFDAGIEYDFSKELFPGLLEAGLPLYGHIAGGYWSDIGSLQQYRQTQFDMLDGRARVEIRGTQTQPGVYLGNNVTLAPNTRLRGPAYIGDGSRIEDGVEIGEYSIIGRNNVLSAGSVLGRTILWDHNHIFPGGELLGSTLGSRVTCREAVQLADGSVVGSHCVIGPKAVVHPGVKIWPKKEVRENAQVSTSFIWGDSAHKPLYKTSGVTGTPNIEMTPEFAARFATAYGATAGPGSTLTVSSSAHEFSRLLKRTLAAGLQSVGVHVVDLGELLSPVARFAIRQLGASGGLHVQMDGSDSSPGPCRIECYDGQALPLSKALERKVENAYGQEDYRRPARGELGTLHEDDTMNELYLKTVLAAVRPQQTGAGEIQLRAVVCTSPHVFSLARPLLGALNCELVHLPAEVQRGQLPAHVQALSADLGLWFDDDGRGMELVTAGGEPVPRDHLMLLQYLSFFHSFPASVIGAPVSAPQLLESLAGGLSCQVVRTKESIRAIMEASADLALHPLYDGLFAAGLILQNMHRSGVSIQGLLELIPAFYLQRERVDCPWDRKGQVMRRMMQQTQGRQVDLVDGIRFHHDGGWVLLLPDSDEPHFNVVAHGQGSDQVQELMQLYRSHILDCMDS